jgi:hypothetical protein
MTTESESKSKVGFVAFERGILNHPQIGAKKPYSRFEAWTWLIFEAAWKPRRVGVHDRHGALSVVNLERGQLTFSLRFMAEAWGWSVKAVRSFLNLLERQSMIGTKRGIAKGTAQNVITLCNYERYQNPEVRRGTQKGTQKARKGHKLEQVNKLTIVRESDSPSSGTFDKGRESPKTSISDSWTPNIASVDKAERLGFVRAEISVEAEKFRNNAKQNDRRCVDWDAAFDNWMIRGAGFLNRKPPQSAAPSGTVVSFPISPGSPQWVAWKAHHQDRDTPEDRQMVRLLNNYELSGRGFDFTSQWPPGMERTA